MAEDDGRFSVAEVRLEVRIAAPPSRVWAGLTRDAGRWWPREILTRPDAKRFVVEPRIGGRVYEDAGDGEGLVWYRVTGVEAPRRLILSGDLFPAFGGPGQLFTTFVLEPAGEGTLVRLEEIATGRLSAKIARALEDGWRRILEGGLRAWAEAPRRKV